MNADPDLGGLDLPCDIAELISDYPEAIVRIANLRAAKVQHLVFGWVELYPFDMRAPSGWTAGAKPWPVPGSSGWTMTFSAARLPTQAALKWYAKAARGQINVAVKAPKPILAKEISLSSEPIMGRFATGDDAPFAMRWHDRYRIHRLVPMQRPSRAVWKLGSVPGARAWLKENLGFDPYEYGEWLCGAALLAPDPVCASFQVNPTGNAPVAEEVLSIRATPRRTADRTADLTTLTMHLVERRAGAWTSINSVRLSSDGFATVACPQPTHEIGWAVICSRRGLLRAIEPKPWIHSMNLNMTMSGGVAQVEVPSGGRRKPAQSYEVAARMAAETSRIGSPVAVSARKRLQRLIADRRRRQAREAAPQRLFGTLPQASQAEIENGKKAAQDFIVQLVRRARRRLIFVDPYFGVREMRLFALQNHYPAITPRILTGLPALRTLVGETQGFQVQQGLVLRRELEELKRQLGDRAPEVRIMPGQDMPAIHDRYLVVDDEVWHCGPSFNELGDRLGVIVRLPDPIGIRVLVAKVWLQAQDLFEAMRTNAGKDA